jgi:hypothetical protein
MSYKVANPRIAHLGKTYGEWASQFTVWLFSTDPDQHNNGQVVFLRGMPYPTPPDYIPGSIPNVMVGDDRLSIFSDQFLFVPVIFAYWASADPAESEISLHDRARVDIDNGDNPPDTRQVTIDGAEINLIDKDGQKYYMADFRIESPLFPLSVPDTEDGTSLKDYIEYPLTPGENRAVTMGYFLLLKFEAGDYIIHSYARGRTTEHGRYNEEFLYQVKVLDANLRPSPSQLRVLEPKSTSYLLAKLDDKSNKQEITRDEFTELKNIVNMSRYFNERTVLEVRLDQKLLRAEITPEEAKKLRKTLHDHESDVEINPLGSDSYAQAVKEILK